MSQASTSASPWALRPARDADQAFLMALFARTRSVEMGLCAANAPWDEHSPLRPLMELQYWAQKHQYLQRHPGAQQWVLEQGPQAVGRLILAETTGSLDVLDIRLLPEIHGQGLGSACLRSLMTRASAQSQVLRLQVDPRSPALRLYQRLGFHVSASDEMNWHMAWNVRRTAACPWPGPERRRTEMMLPS